MDYWGGGGGQRLCWPPSQIIGRGGGGGLASTLPTPMQINALVRLNCIQLSSVGGDRYR